MQDKAKAKFQDRVASRADLGLSAGQDRYLNERIAAAICGVSVKSLQAWRYSGLGPPVTIFGRRAVRYRLSSLMVWAAAREIRRA